MCVDQIRKSSSALCAAKVSHTCLSWRNTKPPTNPPNPSGASIAGNLSLRRPGLGRTKGCTRGKSRLVAKSAARCFQGRTTAWDTSGSTAGWSRIAAGSVLKASQRWINSKYIKRSTYKEDNDQMLRWWTAVVWIFAQTFILPVTVLLQWKNENIKCLLICITRGQTDGEWDYIYHLL